jgi:hypothetical protein
MADKKKEQIAESVLRDPAKDPVVKTTPEKKPRSKTAPRKAKDTDETTRASVHPSANEPGPLPLSEKPSEDERGAKGPRGKKDDVVLPEGERHSQGEPRRRVHEEAAQQSHRDTHAPTGVEETKVEGEKLQTVATPGKLDPFELKPSKRDTVVKDQLRAEGNAFHADAPVREPVGGDWHDTDVRVSADVLKPRKNKKGE